MIRLILGSIVLFALGYVLMAEEPQAEKLKKEEIEKALVTFAGTWEIVAVTPETATKNARRLVFKKDGAYAAQDKDRKELWAGTFEIDPTTTPNRWDHRSHDARKEGKDILGIYELDGDKLKVACVAGKWDGKTWIGKDRPKKLDPQHADIVIDLKRVKVDE